MRTIRLGISTCPNDTFAFHALLEGAVDAQGLDLAIELRDVEDLNRRLADGRLDAAKTSFFAALRASDRLCVLPAGSALGFGVGPLLLAAPGWTDPSEVLDGGRAPRVLCPGEGTTAHLLYRAFHPRQGAVEQVVFSAILPALARREADFGVVIHEGRFTWQGRGLRLVEDLGATWEARTGLPLPLGGIAAAKSLGPDVHGRLARAIQASIDHALAHREETLPTMRAHAEEHDDRVIWAHVDLYVNAWTRDLGAQGRHALRALAELAETCGLVPRGAAALEIAGV